MHKRNILTILVIGLVLAFGAEVFAQGPSSGGGSRRRPGPSRKGFIIGGGLGLGNTSFTQSFGPLESPSVSKIGVQSDFKIGFGASEQLLIYYTSKVSWFSIENVYLEDVTIANGFGGVGISYYFRPQAPGGFISGGLGFSTWSAPFEDGGTTWVGGGLSIGGGYEFASHWSVEADLIFTNPSDSEFGITAKTNSTTIRVTINALHY